jgi:NIMA-interacting peptidyl-prolyl cis-trans isomerase 1
MGLRVAATAWEIALCSAVLVGCGSAASPAATADAAPFTPAPASTCLALASVDRPAPPASAGAISVRHVLVKHAAARNPAPGVTRSREQACARAIEARDAVLAGASFDDAVERFSDEPGAKSRGGLVGEVRPSDVDPRFGAAAFELERGQMSDVVESPSGFHLILRTE